MGSNVRVLADLTPETRHFVISLFVVAAVVAVLLFFAWLLFGSIDADDEAPTVLPSQLDGVGSVTGRWLTGQALAAQQADEARRRHTAAPRGRHTAGAR